MTSPLSLFNRQKHMTFLALLCLTLLSMLGKAETHMQAADEPTSNSVDGVSDERFARLAKGVNLSFWLWLAPSGDFDPDAYTERDMQLLQAAGMTHVRLPFEPEKLAVDVSDPSQMREDYLAEMDRAISMALKYDLAVIVDPHPQNDLRYNMATDDEVVARMTQLWHALAAHMSKYDPEMVFLETMNEPAFLQFMDAEQALERWATVQELLVAALRAGAPDHTIIVKGDQWDNIDSLLRLDVYDDRNIIYNIHFYEPFIFTHQGADWSDEYLIGLENVPYPSSLQAIAPLLDVYSGDQREAIYQYGTENWNAETVSQAVKVAADWAQDNNVRLTANEFGVYKPTTAVGARYALLHDMRVAFEQYNIGWTMWDYQGGFDLVEGEGDARYITPEMTEALGLNIVLASR